MQYNNVAFGKKKWRHLNINARSVTGGTLIISTEDAPGKAIAKMTIPKGDTWAVIKENILAVPSGVKNLVVELKGSGNVEVDWIRFE